MREVVGHRSRNKAAVVKDIRGLGFLARSWNLGLQREVETQTLENQRRSTSCQDRHVSWGSMDIGSDAQLLVSTRP